MSLSTRLLTLRRSPILLQLPPYLSALCIAAGIAWLLLLPLNEYSRHTYISENAILPGQVHTYFGGSEHHVFRAYRQDVWSLSSQSEEERIAGLERILRENGLKTARQAYRWNVAGEEISGTNVYGLIRGPRADATEAMVLVAAWRNFEDQINYSGVALTLTLARYFKRWSIWSKDIIVLIPGDSTYGPEAWVSAYHSTSSTNYATRTRNVSALPLKAGALQGAVALDYPVGPWGQRFSHLDILYDGINGALPNLDLLNTAVQIASSQLNLPCTLHHSPGAHINPAQDSSSNSNAYQSRLRTLLRGLGTQSLGHATGPHSAFMPYHVDAITLKTVGEDGWHDEITLGRVTESLVRSLNNLLEHLHQSFFFYLLLSPTRFVSIGNYLPAAMVVAGGFTVSALGLWVLSSKVAVDGEEEGKKGEGIGGGGGAAHGLGSTTATKEKTEEKLDLEVVKEGKEVVLVPKKDLEVVERKMLLPAVVLLAVHLAGLAPLYFLTHVHRASLPRTLHTTTALTLLTPPTLARFLANKTSPQQTTLLQSFSLLLLGATLSTLATLNFSLALLIGLLCSPLTFLRPLPCLYPAHGGGLKTKDEAQDFARNLAVAVGICAGVLAVSPPVGVYALSVAFSPVRDLEGFLVEMARGWNAQGVWTALVVCGVWWPAWVVGGSVLLSGALRRSSSSSSGGGEVRR